MPSHEPELRLAAAADLPFLSELARDPSVEPYLAPDVSERLDALLAQMESEGPPGGLFVIQDGPDGSVGGLALTVYSARSRVCNLTTLMVSPSVRRTGIGAAGVRLACRYALVECGFHRIQAETYGDNMAGQRLFDRLGFTREGVRRGAYWRRDQWLDGVMFGLLAEEFQESR